jgi:hypothetical protein
VHIDSAVKDTAQISEVCDTQKWRFGAWAGRFFRILQLTFREFLFFQALG